MKKITFLVRYGLLAIMVILGLIAVFPQSLDLMDMVFAKRNAEQAEELYSKEYPKKSKSTWSFSKLFEKNRAPSRNEIIDYLQSIKNVTDVICVGEIPKVVFDEDKAKISPPYPSIAFQIITQSMNTPALRTGRLKLNPNIHHVGSAMPMANWFDSNKLKGWNFKASMNRGKLLSQTVYSTMNKKRVKKCD